MFDTTSCQGFPECFRFCGCQAEADREPKCDVCLNPTDECDCDDESEAA